VRDRLVVVAVLLGYVFTCVAIAIELGVWAFLWAGLLLMVGALLWDARG
jgi:hypothetical protein